ncbi:MAG: OmpH family outer membrane protein [Rhodospirillaceae bacterium]|jgi:Skp family chaperone for outer membrane proteins|nr:OmpH family outer membrane protein [Rhodospirillaceae bacterium]MBT3491807.1 OmpH family outer membrane protein [Rhodospirillaceae bacterium]MBT3783137.1 OmpH family outer membrane protein [Rhodospirillaceae bacterium]MBT3978133.1 OmpH family outer membrane protein [Rhodospirillaceae bacterium]MBT4171076.1 OmpH family outer membrane protein [Rhodospirillaceae bacterium]
MARWIGVVAAAMAAGLLASPVAAAEVKAAAKAPAGKEADAKGPVIAVLDVQLVMRRAAAAKGISTAMEARRKAFEEEIATEREALKAEEQKLRKQGAILSPEAMNERRRVLENKISDLRRKAEQRRGILNRAFTGATRKLRSEMAKVLAEVMSERKITLTLARKAVLVFDQRLSVTEEVLKRLDKNMPNVAVDFKNSGAK